MPMLTGGVVTYTNADTSFVAMSAGVIALNGFRLGKSSELTLALRSRLELGLNAVAVHEDFSAARWRVLGGGSMAFAYRVNERWSLSPGVVVLVPYDLRPGCRHAASSCASGTLVADAMPLPPRSPVTTVTRFS